MFSTVNCGFIYRMKPCQSDLTFLFQQWIYDLFDWNLMAFLRLWSKLNIVFYSLTIVTVPYALFFRCNYLPCKILIISVVLLKLSLLVSSLKSLLEVENPHELVKGGSVLLKQDIVLFGMWSYDAIPKQPVIVRCVWMEQTETHTNYLWQNGVHGKNECQWLCILGTNYSVSLSLAVLGLPKNTYLSPNVSCVLLSLPMSLFWSLLTQAGMCPILASSFFTHAPCIFSTVPPLLIGLVFLVPKRETVAQFCLLGQHLDCLPLGEGPTPCSPCYGWRKGAYHSV